MLEAVHRDLTERRRDRVLDPAGEKVEAAARVVLVGEQALERERLAEHRGRLGRRQRRRRVEVPERLRAGGSRPPEELARAGGRDRPEAAIWESGIDALAEELAEAERLAAEIGLG
jgi:hypothetical protein